MEKGQHVQAQILRGDRWEAEGWGKSNKQSQETRRVEGGPRSLSAGSRGFQALSYWRLGHAEAERALLTWAEARELGVACDAGAWVSRAL